MQQTLAQEALVKAVLMIKSKLSVRGHTFDDMATDALLKYHYMFYGVTGIIPFGAGMLVTVFILYTYTYADQTYANEKFYFLTFLLILGTSAISSMAVIGCRAHSLLNGKLNLNWAPVAIGLVSSLYQFLYTVYCASTATDMSSAVQLVSTFSYLLLACTLMGMMNTAIGHMMGGYFLQSLLGVSKSS